MANPSGPYELEVSDREYLSHGGKPLLARLLKPRGQGPFPAIVEAHGGAWTQRTRVRDLPIYEPLASSGVVVMAVDFRMPPEASYPASLADINYAIRWFKAHAAEFGSRPDLVGSLGTSSGGHQVMLLGMKPRDPSYASVPLPTGTPDFDASVRCVVMCWPVVDPLARYRYALKLKQSAEPAPAFVDAVLPGHDAYWKTEAAMTEGNPQMILDRGEAVQLPPAQYIHGTIDLVVPPGMAERFALSYRKAGGTLEMEPFEGEDHVFITETPDSPASRRALQKIIEFVHRTVR